VGLNKETLDFIEVISFRLKECVDTNLARKYHPSKFCGHNVPLTPLEKYLERGCRYLNLDVPHLVAMVIYINRFVLINEEHNFLHQMNIHRLAFMCLFLSHKFLNDDSFDNASAAQVGGISLSQLNGLEVDLLFTLQFKLYISPTEYYSAKKEVVTWARRVEKKESKEYLVNMSVEDDEQALSSDNVILKDEEELEVEEKLISGVALVIISNLPDITPKSQADKKLPEIHDIFSAKLQSNVPRLPALPTPKFKNSGIVSEPNSALKSSQSFFPSALAEKTSKAINNRLPVIYPTNSMNKGNTME
jgi:hypothetical protein